MSEMEKVLIIGCKKAMDEICVGCSRCLVALNRYEGEFSRYRETRAELIGIASCGDCPGYTLIGRLALMKVWNSASFSEEPTKIHLAQCLVNCSHSESMVEKLKAKCRVEIVKGTHPYQMESIFG